MVDSKPTGGRPSLFISYARADDEPFVDRLHRDLKKAGFPVWWDRAAMESRGRTFLQEIRDAIEGVDRFIAVIGPKAVVSEVVRYEWEHASLFAKAVVPILRLGNYDLIPDEILPEAGYGLAEDAPNRRRIEIGSNTVERSIRPIALNRKNALFAGHDLGAENWAVLASLIETCKLHGVNPEAWSNPEPSGKRKAGAPGAPLTLFRLTMRLQPAFFRATAKG